MCLQGGGRGRFDFQPCSGRSCACPLLPPKLVRPKQPRNKGARCGCHSRGQKGPIEYRRPSATLCCTTPVHGQQAAAASDGSKRSSGQPLAGSVGLLSWLTPTALWAVPRAGLSTENNGLLSLCVVLCFGFCWSPGVWFGGAGVFKACLLQGWRGCWALPLWSLPRKLQTGDVL